MRAPKIILAVLLLEALLAGCGTDESSTAEPGKSATSTPTGTGETIPDGSYAKSITVAGAKKVGIADQGYLQENFNEHRPTIITFKIAGDTWTQFVTPGGGAPEPGDVGTLTYDAHRNAVLTSESDGCPGCVYVYKWQLEGPHLTLTIVGHESSEGPAGLVITRFVTAGVFTRQS